MWPRCSIRRRPTSARGGRRSPSRCRPALPASTRSRKFRQFNRGLAAKADVYLAFRGYAPLGPVVGAIDATYLDSAQAALTASFMIADATKLDVGPAHSYSTATGDALKRLVGPGSFEDRLPRQPARGF